MTPVGQSRSFASRFRVGVPQRFSAESAGAIDRRSAGPRTLLPWLQQAAWKPYFILAAICFGLFVLLPSGDWRLLAVSLTAASFDFGVILLGFRFWPGGLAVSGLVLCVLVHAIGLAALCVWGLLGYLQDYEAYSVLLNFEGRVLLMLTTLPLAVLLTMWGRMLWGVDQTVAAKEYETQQISSDNRLPVLLICSAVFSLLFWMGSELSLGIASAVCQALQRTFFFVSFLAGFHFRTSRVALVTWILVLGANLGLGIVTGNRGPAFMPVFLFALGLLAGATFRQRLVMMLAMVVAGIPIFYVFGMIEVIRNDVGRLRVSEISSATIKEVVSGLKEKRQKSGDAYEEIPSMAKSFIRIVNWPNLVVGAVAGGGSGNYRGFSDLPDQLRASLNIVALTGKMDSYYVAGLYNLGASNYGFQVDEGTSVEFGLLAESWDRGGPLAAFIYSLIAIAALGSLERFVRSILKRSPALRAIMVSTIFTTAFWTLNVYNLPLSLRQLMVNLLFSAIVIGSINMIIPRDGEIAAEVASGHSVPKPAHRLRPSFQRWPLIR